MCKRQSKTSSRFPVMCLHDSLMMSTVGQRNGDQSDCESFQRAIFYQVLDCLTAELQRHFSNKNCEIMQGVQSLNPKSTTFLDEEPLAFAQTFESHLEDLKHEVNQTKRLLVSREKSGMDLRSTLLELLCFWNLP